MECNPVFIINFKAYKEGVGKRALLLALTCEKVGKECNVDMIVAVQEQDIYRISSQVDIPVFTQHIDPISFGAFTGHELPEGMKESGASGTLINHAEHKLDIDTIKKTVERAKEVGLKTVVCANTPELAAKVAEFNPDYIAIEPPELIGSETSVSTAKPEIITDTIRMVKKVKDIPILCGAGIKDKNDIIVALKLGAAGILAASHIVKAKDPEKVLRELAEGAKDFCGR
jgi:triosephosphate isomerase